MYLKGLTMQGFKSFADKITLDFSNGITAIVGPNGSGKSNINDAVRWVLGEQSAKSLRGSKMEDVIFAGTQKRSPLGFAEVTLTLDNSDKAFNINFDEVNVTRRVYASGESNYLINNSPCRLRDIHEIFMDTGLGRDGYSMIGQGKIDEILSTKSEDRRQIFEEAAGISKYRYRKEEAERKLKNTEENLSRVLDITKELEGQLEPLLKQSEKAKKYLSLKEELKVYEVNNAILVISKSKEELKDVTEKLKISQNHLDSAKEELLKTEEAQGVFYNQAKESEEILEQTQQKLNELSSEISLNKGEIDVFLSTISGNEKLTDRIEAEKSELLLKEDAALKKQAESESFIEQKNEQIKKLEEETEMLKKESEDLMVGMDSKNDEIEKLKDDVVQKMNEISEMKIKLSNADIIKENLKSKLLEIKKVEEERACEKKDAKNKLDALSTSYFAKEKFVENILSRLKSSEDELKKISNSLSELKKELEEKNILISEKQSKITLLKQMEQNLEGYAKSVKEVINAKKSGALKGAAILGPVSKIFNVQDEFLQAIEAAIGGAMQNIVAEKESDAKAAILYLKANKLGRATFMPVSSMRGSLLDVKNIEKEDGYINIAAKLCDYNEKYSGVINSLLGKIVVVDTIDNGIKMSKKYKNSFKIVTLSGEVFSVGGAMSGGSSNHRVGVLGRESEIRTLENSLYKDIEEVKRLEASIKELSDSYNDTEEKMLDERDVYQENKEILIALDKDISHVKEILCDYDQNSQKILEEEKQINEMLISCEKEKDEAVSKTEELTQKIDALKEEINKHEEDYEAVIYKKEDILSLIIEKNTEKNLLENDIQNENEKIEGLVNEIRFIKTSIELRISEQRDVLEKNAELKDSICQREATIEENNKKCDELKLLIESLRVKRSNFEQKSLAAQAELKEKNDIVLNMANEVNRIENKKTKIDMELETIIAKLWEDYELTFTSAESYKKDLSGENITAKITSLKASIRALGNINVDAIEEYKNVKERFDFLTSQKDDLENAKANLGKIIAEMTDVMKEKFRTEFAKINENFKETFVELFGGGKASLSLEDETNILESGINIDVQPPGKKLQSLSLLSGGERAFSAIALLFAIFKTRPTPFCFLDEIEAALDDVNVYRFADYVKTYTGKTQFIIVTHRRGTMESADVIYGVTMQEKGVSKLLKLDINEVTS